MCLAAGPLRHLWGPRGKKDGTQSAPIFLPHPLHAWTLVLFHASLFPHRRRILADIVTDYKVAGDVLEVSLCLALLLYEFGKAGCSVMPLCKYDTSQSPEGPRSTSM